MTTALLDVNVLIALFDNTHQYHFVTNQWLADHVLQGNRWATCPITQNGCLRILSTPSYPNPFSLSAIKHKLQKVTAHPSHEFWSADISLTDDSLVNWSHITGHKQLTDVYLLALTAHHHGIFVSLDTKIPNRVVYDFPQDNMIVLI